jgi:hypothetical protein
MKQYRFVFNKALQKEQEEEEEEEEKAGERDKRGKRGKKPHERQTEKAEEEEEEGSEGDEVCDPAVCTNMMFCFTVVLTQYPPICTYNISKNPYKSQLS